MSRASCHGVSLTSSFATGMAAGRFTAETRNFKPIRTGKISSFFMNTFTGIAERDLAPVTRPVGPDWFASCFSRVENKVDGKSNARTAGKEYKRCNGLRAEQAKILRTAEMRA